MSPLAHEVPYENVTALCDAETEEVDEHDHVVAVGSGSKRFVTDLVDEICDDYLRQTIRDVLTHGRDADVQQIPQFLPRDGTEISQREAGDMYLKMNGTE